MSRFAGILNLIQVAVCVGLAVWLWPRWMPAGALVAVAALAQLAAALALLIAQRAPVARLLSALTLALVALLYGLVLRGGLHIIDRFGDDAGEIARGALGVFGLALPWLVAIPLWQVLAGRQRPTRSDAATIAAVVLGLGLPAAWGAVQDAPTQRWAAQPALTPLAEAAWARWTGQPAAPAAAPQGSAQPAVVLLTPWLDGKAGETAYGAGESLQAAMDAALAVLPPATSPAQGLVVDVARARYRAGGLVPTPDGGALGPDGGTSPSRIWKSDRVQRRELLPRAWAHQPRKLAAGSVPARFDSVVVVGGKAHPMAAGWSSTVAQAEVDADAVLAAALEAGRFLARHQEASGRFAYTVEGSGKAGSGYNFPRHAGTTWFLARLAARTGDAEIAKAADRGVAYIAAHTSTRDGERQAYFADSGRRDGKVWVGTTALAALALVERAHPLALPYGRFLAASVDETGQVRGELALKTDQFPPQRQNPYGQGQTLLALAALVRAGHAELRPALDRAAAFLDGAYAPGAAGKLVVLDEHWACLAALAVRDATGTPAGTAICSGYLHSGASRTPGPSSALYPIAGPAGGHAEAVVAGAFLDPSAPWTDEAIAYGRWFLQSAYTPGDAPFLPDAGALLGGFRDNPLRLEVRMDAVQHIGCALLGIEALLRGRTAPGSLP